MPQYSYKAVNQEGKYRKGKMTVNSPAQLSSILKNQGMEIISYKIEKDEIFSISISRIKPNDLVTTFVHLEQLDRAGVTILDSISDLTTTSDSAAVRGLMQEIYESIKNGALFSEAMSRRPDIFNSVYVGLVASGEKTGNLADSFKSIVEDLKWNIQFKRKVRKASVGPSFAIVMMLGIIGLMMGFVVPKVTGFLALQEIELPTSTIYLMNISKFVQTNWLKILVSFPAIFITYKLLSKIDEVGIKLDFVKLKLPIFGPIMTKLDAARFCKFFAMTFKSGLGVIECLESSSMVIKNRAFKRSITFIKVQVSEGQSLAKAIASSEFFPPLVVRMFKVGEESGNMDDALKNITFFYDTEINDSIDRLVSMIQPALTIIMGGLILWVVSAVFGPIYSSFSNIQ